MSAKTPPSKIKAKSKKDPKRGAVGDERRPSMKTVGRDPVTGKTKPHTRNERTARAIMLYVAGGHSENDIAAILDIRPGLLRSCYAKELEHGTTVANMEVVTAMHKAAKEGDVAAGKFWLKARAGWKDGEGATTASPLAIHIHE